MKCDLNPERYEKAALMNRDNHARIQPIGIKQVNLRILEDVGIG